ncbi:hypothetical protein [Streptomyces sp. NBC_01235]|uniref:hypothetical protein n=1 Tax=Streptomyces sp. NBC_01235 TaxID=2903788 RepID=UPI002E133931|nr:hypothetical protein OG289_07255 [Streptomyces sp. NBC_01235]
MNAAVLRRARRWFWALSSTAVCAAGALYEGLRAAPGPGTGLLVLTGAVVLAVSAVQAARILALLAGRPRPPRWPRAPWDPPDTAAPSCEEMGSEPPASEPSRTGQAPAKAEDAGHADDGHHH